MFSKKSVMTTNPSLNREIKLIAFDADDTLWVNEHHYRNAEHSFADMMSPYCSHEKAIDALLQKEKENLPLLGYGSKPFIISLVECGIELSGGTLDNNQIKSLIALGKETIGRNMELYPDAEPVLQKLFGRYPLVLATKGDLKEQESKVERSGLMKYFTSIEIMSEKHQGNYLKIIDQHGLEPRDFVMVGNSFRSDILPVLEIGGNAVYIPSDIIWAHEVVEESSHPNLVKLENLTQLPGLFNIQ